MGAVMRSQADLLKERAELSNALTSAPYSYDFFQVLRRLEGLHPEQPRLGAAGRPHLEPLRVRQDVALHFAPSSVSSSGVDQQGRTVVEQAFFGHFGPNGPLPIHLTDFVRERIRHVGDHTLSRFLDTFGHRFALYLYRAWVQVRPTASFDRPSSDRFRAYVGSAVGLGSSSRQNRDAAPDEVKLYLSGWLSRHVRPPEGLAALVASFFRLPTRVESFCGHWMMLPESDRTRLGARDMSAKLGQGVVLGKSVWDRQHKFRLKLGPMTLSQYESMLPGNSALFKLDAFVRQYCCDEFFWDAQLLLEASEVPQIRLGSSGRLGWTTWLGRRSAATPAGDLKLDVAGWAERQPPVVGA